MTDHILLGCPNCGNALITIGWEMYEAYRERDCRNCKEAVLEFESILPSNTLVGDIIE